MTRIARGDGLDPAGPSARETRPKARAMGMKVKMTMGNRAVITFDEKPTQNSLGIYLHWNGGPESVLAFMEAADHFGVRGADDDSYQFARIVQIIANYFGGTCSVGVGKLSQLDCDNYDNGTYIVSRGKDGIVIKQCSNERGPWRTLSNEQIKKHSYWNPKEGGVSILDDVISVNESHFKKSESFPAPVPVAGQV